MTMSQNHALIVEEQSDLTLAELCRVCAAQEDFIAELIAEGALEPAGPEPAQWRFTGVQLRHVSVAVRLQRDLGINVAGAALALQLLDEIDTLRERLRGIGAR